MAFDYPDVVSELPNSGFDESRSWPPAIGALGAGLVQRLSVSPADQPSLAGATWLVSLDRIEIETVESLLNAYVAAKQWAALKTLMTGTRALKGNPDLRNR